MLESEFYNIIYNDNEFNFLAFALSSWHANSIDATISWLRSLQITVKGYVIIGEHPVSGRLIDRTNFVNLDADIQLINVEFKPLHWKEKIFNNIKASFQIRKNGGGQRVIYICNASYPDYNMLNIVERRIPNSTIKFIVIDEGCGAYLLSNKNSWVNMHLHDRKEKGNYIDRLLLNLLFDIRRVPKAMMLNVLVHQKRYINNCLLVKDDRAKLKPNKRIRKHYRELFSNYGEKAQLTDVDYSNAIVINTAHLGDQNSKLERITTALERRIIDYAYDRGWRVVVKPHPRESGTVFYNEDKCVIDRGSSCSQEAIIGSLDNRPKCIIALNSSTLININTIFSIPTIGLAKMVLNEDISGSEKESLKRYIDTFDGIVEFPSDFDELINSINAIG